MTLDQFIDEMIEKARPFSYSPTTFMSMRDKYGTVSAIKRLVETSEPQSGFRRLREIGLSDWCLESAVIKFPNEFTKKTIEYARARLDGKLDD